MKTLFLCLIAGTLMAQISSVQSRNGRIDTGYLATKAYVSNQVPKYDTLPILLSIDINTHGPLEAWAIYPHNNHVGKPIKLLNQYKKPFTGSFRVTNITVRELETKPQGAFIPHKDSTSKP